MAHGVLEPVQKRGRAALERLGLPTRREEAWRLTDLKRLEAFARLPLGSGSTASSLPAETEGTLRLLLDGRHDPLEGVDLPEGLTPLTAQELEQALGHTLDRCDCTDSWPVELNHASAEEVLALRVRGTPPPLELVSIAAAGLTATRVILLVEERAELDLMQVMLADGATAAHSHVLELHLGQGSQLRHGLLATADGKPSLMIHVAVEQEPRSSYTFTSVIEGWSFGRVEPRVVQVDGQAQTVLKGLAVACAKQQLATHTAVRFDGPDGELDQFQKCIAGDRAHVIFNGAIGVPRDAQRTNAAQLSRNLLLSDRARVDTKPELEIVADDVRCAHGATVSQLQQDELFYLQSRGIAASDAAALLLRGACQDVIKHLPAPAEAWTPLDRVMEGLAS